MNYKNNKYFNKCNLKLLVLQLAMVLSIASCTHKGYFGVGAPIALSPTKTIDSLNEQKDTVSDESGISVISPFAVNAGHLRSSNLSQRAKIAFSPGANVAAPSTSSINQEKVENATAFAGTAQPAKYSGLVMDGFTSLESYSAHKMDIKEDFDIDIIKKGEEGNIYKIKFDLSVNPLRQDYWTYIWRWLDLVNGLKNYTKDYHAQIDFILKDPNVKVVLVQPVNEGVNTFEMALMQKTSQLAGGATWQGVAAEIDLAERHREQFTQQRKNPILRGVIDSDSTFRYTISPRQYVAQRTFRIPFFMSRYTIERGLDSGLQLPVSAYILVADKNKKKLNIEVCGHYKKMGDPHTTGDNDKHKIPYGIEVDDEDIKCEPFELTLPKNKKLANPVVTIFNDKPNVIGVSWGKPEIIITSDCSKINKESAAVKLRNIGSGDATLEKGEFNGETLFWIESSKKAKDINGKQFVLDFCSKDENDVVLNEKSTMITYIAEDNKYDSIVTVAGEEVTSSTPGQQIKISIYGVPGEKLELNEIKFGNKKVTNITDMNTENHMYEVKVIIPDFEGTQKLSIIAIKKDGSEITVKQKFTIDLAIGSN